MDDTSFKSQLVAIVTVIIRRDVSRGRYARMDEKARVCVVDVAKVPVYYVYYIYLWKKPPSGLASGSCAVIAVAWV